MNKPGLRLVSLIYFSWINKYQKILRTPDVGLLVVKATRPRFRRFGPEIPDLSDSETVTLFNKTVLLIENYASKI